MGLAERVAGGGAQAAAAGLRLLKSNDTGTEDVANQNHTQHEVVHQEGEVVAGLILVVLLAIVLYLIHRHWRAREAEREMATGLLNDSSTYAANLVRHFVPSLKVAKYQFRGMKPPEATVTVGFNELGLELPNGKKVLDGVTGTFNAGRMCAIMGPSGAGKTTFMNVLCGKATYGKMHGQVLINNYDIDIKEINSVMGFVPQDDVVHQTLTVREQIRFAAQLRNKVNTSKQRIQHITDDVLNVMQIDHIQNSIVGSVEERGISGGQRKRVNIGLELAAQPTLLFLDEPTSGLDSTSSLQVVYSLKKMCQLGMTCIMVIHQPRYSLFTLFDDVLLLGKGGRTVYLGPSLGAKDYFDGLGFEMPKDENRADWFMDVISGEVKNEKIENFEPKMLFDMWNESARGNGITEDLAASPQSTRSHKGEKGRDITLQEDIAVLTRALEDEWERIDRNHDGHMDKEELKMLLTQCSQLEPSSQIVDELMQRMAGEGADRVTKQEFVTYLCNLKHDVAHDRLCGTSPTGNGTNVPFLNWIHGEHNEHKDSDVEGGATDDSASGEEETSSEEETEAMVELTEKQTMRALHRTTPGYCQQLNILSTRTVIQWWRKNQSRSIYFAAMGLGAIVLACQDILVGTPKWDAMSFVNTHTCQGLLICIFCLNVFGNDQPIFWRERNRGLNVLAFYEARLHMNLTDLFMQSFLFTSLYYLIRDIQVSFFMYWVPGLLVAYVASAWGYLISTWLPPQHGPFIASLIMFVIAGLLGNPTNLDKFLDGGPLEYMVSLISVTRWSIPMSFLMQVDETSPTPKPGQETLMLQFFTTALKKGDLQDHLGYWYSGVVALFTQGTVLRVIAYIGLLVRNRSQMV